MTEGKLSFQKLFVIQVGESKFGFEKFLDCIIVYGNTDLWFEFGLHCENNVCFR